MQGLFYALDKDSKIEDNYDFLNARKSFKNSLASIQ